jgi:hypothetical protein
MAWCCLKCLLGFSVVLVFRDWQQHQYGQEHVNLVKQIQEIQKQSSATASELEHHLERQQLMKTK